MGAEPWYYFVPFEQDVNAALQRLRQREFKAGRYNPVMPFLSQEFPITATSPTPGPQHSSIEEAVAASEADGTRSILDMEAVVHQVGSGDLATAITQRSANDGRPLDVTAVARQLGYGVVAALPSERLMELYGTSQPTREMLDRNMDFFEALERGKGIYITVYENGQPSEILFAGYSFD